MLVDMRFLVAAQRYEITKEIRGILRFHFEDYFDSTESVNEVARHLEETEEHAIAITDMLLKCRAESERRRPQAQHNNVDNETESFENFNRVWNVLPNSNDQRVMDFAAWSALLLHMMVHKAYCVLYVPLFKDPSMIEYEEIRMK